MCPSLHPSSAFKRFAEKVRVKKAYRRAVYANIVTEISVPVLAATN
jgi:hypothetical protein